MTSSSKQSTLYLMPAEALVAYRDTSPHPIEDQKPHLNIISPQEYIERTGFAPSIPRASVLHDEYVSQRDLEIKEGKYVPGELLSLSFNQSLLRQLFIDLGRKNVFHEVKNAYGKIVEEGTPIDWYNPTQPFLDDGDRIMAVRFEPRDSELSLVGFIKEDPKTGEYTFDDTRPIFDLAQDPSVTFDDKDNPILGIVKIYANENGKITDYNTVQFRGANVRNLEDFQTIMGKDNRPIQLPTNIVRGFYRPQGKLGGLGKLAFRDYLNWEAYANDVNAHPLTEADFLITNFHPDNHGGPNFPLPDGQIYGHIAEKKYDANGEVIELHYYATWMLTDPKTGQLMYQENPATGDLKPLIKIIADQSDFIELSEKIPDKNLENPQKTHDVVFTAGAEKLSDEKVRITMGIRDTRIGRKVIKDPMLDVDMHNLRLVA